MGIETLTIASFILLGIAAALLLWRLDQWSARPFNYPYVARTQIYSPSERKFLGYLIRAMGEDYIIMGKVRVADILAVESSLSLAKKKNAFEKISKDHVDYLLCERKTMAVVCAVELYDQSFDPKHQIIRGNFLDKAFRAAGIPLIRFPKKDEYRIWDVKRSIDKVLSKRNSPQSIARRSA
ncbi:MAG: DUF2726 domain-containing protein [Pseudomonadales bacterium]|nr:DUF2726 domain-containing protein [Pseudomonadales bacterium]